MKQKGEEEMEEEKRRRNMPVWKLRQFVYSSRAINTSRARISFSPLFVNYPHTYVVLSVHAEEQASQVQLHKTKGIQKIQKDSFLSKKISLRTC